MPHRDMENSIVNIRDLPSSYMDSLKSIKADVVIFGELNFDTGSGVYEVVVTFQNLNEIILKKEVVSIKKSLIDDNQFRRDFMRDLINQLHAKEVFKVKETI